MCDSQWWHLQYLMQIVTDGLMTRENPGHDEQATINENNRGNITLNNATSCTVLCIYKTPSVNICTHDVLCVAFH